MRFLACSRGFSRCRRRLRPEGPALPARQAAAGRASRRSPAATSRCRTRASARRRKSVVAVAFAYRNGVLCAEEVPLDDIARRFGTPCYVYSRAAIEARLPRVRERAAGARRAGLLLGQGELEPRRPRAARAPRRRLRHRLGRRAGARPRRGRRPAQDAVLRRRQDRGRDPLRAGEGHRLHQSGIRGGADEGRRGRAAARQARAGRVPRQSRHRREDPSVHLHRPAREQVRRGAWRRRAALRSARATWPASSSSASAATSARCCRTRAPFVAAAERLVALVDRLERGGIRAAAHRRRRRHRHPLQGRGAAAARQRSSAACSPRSASARTA